MRPGGTVGFAMLGLFSFAALATAQEAPESAPSSASRSEKPAARTPAPERSSRAPVEKSERPRKPSPPSAEPAARRADESEPRPADPEDAAQAPASRGKLPPADDALPPVTAAAVTPPDPESSWIHLMMPDRRYWQPLAPRLVLWLRGPYDDVVTHEHEPLVLGDRPDGETEYRHELKLSSTSSARIEGYMKERRAEQACIAGQDCRGRDIKQGVRVVDEHGRFIGLESARQIQGTPADPIQTLQLVTGRQW